MIILPLPGEAVPGQLILNPDPQDLAGFTIDPLPRRVAHFDGSTVFEPFDQAIPSCPDSTPAQQTSCAQVGLDTGATSGLPPFYAYAILFNFNRGVIGVHRRPSGG